MTPLQGRAARAALSWSKRKAAKVANILVSDLSAFEEGTLDGPRRAGRLKSAYERQGINFLSEGDLASGPGIALSDRFVL